MVGAEARFASFAATRLATRLWWAGRRNHCCLLHCKYVRYFHGHIAHDQPLTMCVFTCAIG